MDGVELNQFFNVLPSGHSLLVHIYPSDMSGTYKNVLTGSSVLVWGYTAVVQSIHDPPGGLSVAKP